MKPVIAITMGDPAGVGPEVIIKALMDPQLNQSFCPLIVGKSAGVSGESAGHDFGVGGNRTT